MWKLLTAFLLAVLFSAMTFSAVADRAENSDLDTLTESELVSTELEVSNNNNSSNLLEKAAYPMVVYTLATNAWSGQLDDIVEFILPSKDFPRAFCDQFIALTNDVIEVGGVERNVITFAFAHVHQIDWNRSIQEKLKGMLLLNSFNLVSNYCFQQLGFFGTEQLQKAGVIFLVVVLKTNFREFISESTAVTQSLSTGMVSGLFMLTAGNTTLFDQNSSLQKQLTCRLGKSVTRTSLLTASSTPGSAIAATSRYVLENICREEGEPFRFMPPPSTLLFLMRFFPDTMAQPVLMNGITTGTVVKTTALVVELSKEVWRGQWGGGIPVLIFLGSMTGSKKTGVVVVSLLLLYSLLPESSNTALPNGEE